jgi:hypothetical protein
MTTPYINDNWNKLIGKSNYHFDPTVVDDPESCVQILGHIQPFWEDLLPDIIKNSTPITWQSKGNGIKPDKPLSQEQLDNELILGNFNWELPPILQALVDQFGFENCLARLHVQVLGQVWSLHIDHLDRFAPEDPSRVMRINIPLNDWQLGQSMDYGTYTWKHWQAGDVMTFDWYNMPHSTANAGYHPRVTLQITGARTAKTEEMLAWLATTNKK